MIYIKECSILMFCIVMASVLLCRVLLHNGAGRLYQTAFS